MRLFIATSFPEAVMRELNEVISRVKTRLPPSSWVKPGSQHLTFAFLGEQPEAVVGRIEPLLRDQLSRVSKFEARLHGAGFFPNARHARVAWIGVTPEPQFHAVAASVRKAVDETGVKLDGSEFKAHLTLCRIRDHWPPACIEIFNSTFGKVESEPFTVERVTLYSSQLNPKGAIHTPLREFSLA